MAHEFNAEDIARVNQLRSIKTLIKRLQEDEKALKDDIIASLKDAGALEGADQDGSVIATLSTYDRTTLNTKEVEAMYPAVYEACKKTTSVTTFKVSEA